MDSANYIDTFVTILHGSLCTDVCRLIKSFCLPTHYYAIKPSISSILDDQHNLSCRALQSVCGIETECNFQLHRYLVTAAWQDPNDMIDMLKDEYEDTIYENLLSIIKYYRYALTKEECMLIYNHVMEGKAVRKLARFVFQIQHEFRIGKRTYPPDYEEHYIDM